MTAELRETGLSILGQMPWGTHFCLFYATQQDLLDILVPYFQAGLENREFCLWVIRPPLTQAEVWNALQQAVADLESYQAAGSIEILGWEGWYLKDGAFDVPGIINNWEEKRNQALARGYAGMRVSGEVVWLQQKSQGDFEAYETELSKVVASQRVIALCTFALEESAAGDILNVLRSHDRAVLRRNGQWEVVETPELRQAKQELARLNQELEERVIQRTHQLVIANEALKKEIAERQRTEAAEREQRVLAEALRDTAADLNSTLDCEEVYNRVLENVGRVVAHDASILMLHERGYWRVERHRGFSSPEVKAWLEDLRLQDELQPLLYQILKSTEPRLISDTQTYPDWVEVAPLAWVHSWLSVPIRSKGRIIGAINLLSASPNFFTPLQSGRLQIFADQAALAIKNAQLVLQVQTGREQLQALSSQLLEVQEAERRLIARELHDQVGQLLIAVSANLRLLEHTSKRTLFRQRLEESLKLIELALNQVRNLSLDLRPFLLDDFGLIAALEWYLQRAARIAGLEVVFVAEPSQIHLSTNLETTCFRVVQIAVTNIVRHANASQVWVELRVEEQNLILTIRDNGAGFDVTAALNRSAEGATFGLLSMQERVRLLGGLLQIKSAPGEGTEIEVQFPID